MQTLAAEISRATRTAAAGRRAVCWGAIAAALLAAASLTPCRGADDPPAAKAAAADAAKKPPALWLYLSTNLLPAENIPRDIALICRAAAAGYTHVMLADSKFLRWDIMPKHYYENVRQVRDACRQSGVQCYAAVCPIGYSNDLLSRDPNLAEGLPVVQAPFVARQGRLVPDDRSASIANGGFETYRNHMPKGWSFVDAPGEVSFIDTEVKCEGRASLRMQDIGRQAAHRNGRACQKLAVEPFRYYHVSAAVKTRSFEAAGEVRIAVLAALAADGASLNWYQPKVEPTQDWKRIDVTFNSLDHREVNLYLGVWGGRGGVIWWDDVRIEPAGLVNVVRRAGAPLSITSADGATTYVEGEDFDRIADPKLGVTPFPGCYSAWHDPPMATIPAGSRIAEGQRVLASYYHAAVIHDEQVMCCMAEPKVREILQWQIAQVHRHVQPDGYYLSHDEIRVQGWDASCRATGKTPGELLAANVAECVALVRGEDPGKPIYVWSDMFDPFHNAEKKGKYYLVRGDGPWYGSWKGLPREVGVSNWNSDPAKRRNSLAHFAGLGHRQLLAGYYDGPVEAIRPWLRDALAIGQVDGVMYTTWQSRYDDLEAFAKEVRKDSR